MSTTTNFKLSARTPQIILVNDWSAHSKVDRGHTLISILSPGERSPTYERFSGIKYLYEFEDLTPEQLIGKSLPHLSDEDIEKCNLSLATYEEVDDILTKIEYYIHRDYKKGALLLHSDGPGRASSFAIAAELIKTSSYREAISNVVRDHKEIKPNMWVCGLIDYIMRCNGQFTSVVEEMLATGIVVSPYGEVFEMEWKLEI